MRSPSPSPTERSALARLLAACSTALLVVFACNALSAGFPLQLLDPLWQLRFTNTLITLGPVALIGFFLMPVASWFDPGNAAIARSCRRVQRWGLLAVLGYLLLIPLQGLAVVQAIGDAQRGVQRQQLEGQRRVEDLRQAVTRARSARELQERFAALKAPAIPLDNLSLPLPVLQRRYLDSLRMVEGQLRQARSSSVPLPVARLLQDGLRVIVCGLAFALAFAAGTPSAAHPGVILLPGQQTTLLSSWQARFRRGRSPWRTDRPGSPPKRS
ncbi:MAG: hypothetical protein VKK62_10780 [Synechococcaceae cyanobacterium]|nr:hypothetical protein [Synechococcaceae cyanobacterium]